MLFLLMMSIFKKAMPPYEELGLSAEKWMAFEQGKFEDKELLQFLPKYKIQAIKFLRKKKNLSLKKALDEINELEKGKSI